MYGYRQSNDNALMTNLNSISSSLSSIDTIGRRGNSSKASADNLITLRSHSIASTSLLWKGSKEDRYATTASGRNGTSRCPGSDIYYSGSRPCTSYCMKSETALNFILVPILLLTITRQVFDFLGQIWLQIIINFFTIILLIVALFGIRQHRMSYLCLYSLWALFNTVWNIIVFCIHTKIRDVGIGEDVLSFYTGATSWWHANGPGCLPYDISSFQPPISILKPNMIAGCRLDYHMIESVQAAIHALLSLLSSLICCCVISNIRRNPSFKAKNQVNSDKLYRLSNLASDRSKINQDPFPSHTSSRFGASNAASLRRAANKTSSRSSQHSVSSMRSARRRTRQSIDGAVPTPRGSTSSMQRSQKYGSLSSRRSNKKERRSDISSLTYGTTGGERNGASNRNRLSSLSSVDYLPSYQPPHSSNANLLSSYGEISSIESYNNPGGQRSSKNRHSSIKTSNRGNTNPTYAGSRSSICSHNTNANNYDDLSYIYGNNNSKTNENIYGASSSEAPDRRGSQIYQQNKTNSISRRNGFRPRDQPPSMPQKIHAETYKVDYKNDSQLNGSDTMAKTKFGMPSGSFQSFSVAPNGAGASGRTDESRLEVNNNHLTSNYADNFDKRGQVNGSYTTNGASNSFDNRSRSTDGSKNLITVTNQPQVYAAQRSSRHPIYSNHASNGNSETPI